MVPLPLHAFSGQREGSVVFHANDGLFYHLSNNRPSRRFAYLVCMHKSTAKYNYCGGTAKALLEQGVLYHMRGHSHAPNIWYPQIQALAKDVRNRVKAGDQTAFHEIIQQEGQKYPLQVRAQFATGSVISQLNALRSSIRPPVPSSIGVLGACLLLPQYEYLTKCLHVPVSLFAGCCGQMANGTLSLVFISPQMRAFMQTRSMIFCDGTERKLFRKPKASQIYVISAVWRFHVIPMVRCIMLRRTQAAYEVLIQFLIDLMPEFRPEAVKCDFEEAQCNAWIAKFPFVTVEGCLWHYARAVFSMARNKLGLYQLVKEEEEVASIIRSAGALPLLPTEDIEPALHDLAIEAVEKGWMAQLRDFFCYMDKEWIPKVPILSVKGSIHRTNNAAESANRMLNKEIKVIHPSVYTVLRAFVATNEKATVDLLTLSAGLAPGRGRKVSALRNDTMIKMYTTDLENGDISRLEFIHKASRRLQNVFNKLFH